MCVTLIGGMDRLKSNYIAAGTERGHILKCLFRDGRNFEGEMEDSDILIVFTNKVSHTAKKKATDFARMRGLPIYMVHSCGISTLRKCLELCERKIFAHTPK